MRDFSTERKHKDLRKSAAGEHQNWEKTAWLLPAAFYITIHQQEAELLNIICSAAEFCLILLPVWAHNNGPICTMQPVLLRKREKNVK